MPAMMDSDLLSDSGCTKLYQGFDMSTLNGLSPERPHVFKSFHSPAEYEGATPDQPGKHLVPDKEKNFYHSIGDVERNVVAFEREETMRPSYLKLYEKQEEGCLYQMDGFHAADSHDKLKADDSLSSLQLAPPPASSAPSICALAMQVESQQDKSACSAEVPSSCLPDMASCNQPPPHLHQDQPTVSDAPTQCQQDVLSLVTCSKPLDSTPSVPCQILTKYVYINTACKKKTAKKSFGVLYKNAFRHFHKGNKLKRAQQLKHKKLAPGQIKPKQVTGERQEKVFNQENWETTASSHAGTQNKLTDGKFTHLKTKATKPSNCVGGEAVKRKILSLEEKVQIVEAMEKSDSTLVSVSEEFGVSRTVLWRILKKRDEIMAKHEAAKSKRRKRCKEPQAVEVKQEKTDSEDAGTPNEEDDWLTSHLPSTKRKPNFRNRKDLTLEEKVKVIKALETPGTKINAMAKKFGVSVSSISRINKNKELIMLKSTSGDLSSKSKRSRECKDPELDRVLLKWYRAIEKTQVDEKISISNVLLKQKAHDLAIVMGKNYFPSDNWIIRWKHRHNLESKTNMIQDREELRRLDTVDIADILEEVGKHQYHLQQVKPEAQLKHGDKPEQFFICEHCGVLTSSKKKRESQHQAGCPASAVRKDLTLEEKVQVVRALEEPGVKMIHLAKRYGVSASAISRIAKNRVDILARKASGLSNGQRKRDRGSKEPEVEKVLCEWFKVQHEMGVHISGSMIREKARDIARLMGKDFWPSESWVFRWRQRNNVSDMNAILYADSEEDSHQGRPETEESSYQASVADDINDIKVSFGEEIAADVTDGDEAGDKMKQSKKAVVPGERKVRIPRSVMCEKCGFVSSRIKNSRVKSLRHAKGCPDMKPRHELTYETRAQMLKALEEPGATLSSVARIFGVSVSSMSRINANKERILNHCLDHSSQKRIRFCKEPEVAHRLYTWYMEKKAEGVHVSGPKLKEKARKMAAEMGREFKASSGWLGRWRHRYNIVSSAKHPDKMDRGQAKKKRARKNVPLRSDEPMLHLQAMQSDIQQDSSASALIDQQEPAMPTLPTQQPVFIHQRFSAPWELAQQQAGSCVWAKEFLSPSGVPEENGLQMSYAYNDGLSKPVFHNMFDSSFSSVGYPVTMDSGMLGREYMKVDNNDDKSGLTAGHMPQGGPSGHVPHSVHPTHQHHTHPHPQLSGNTHLQQQMVPTHSHPHHPQHTLISHPPPPPSPAALDEDPEQQRQVMEAFKIMNSFAQKRSLGEQFQAALRTIEMTVKNQSRKSSSRNTYTSI
ncbi:uncharacterized protein LOC131956403 [Physella acuta]|uniref:uncharacterized protein LOC131956403 n=1 Tax=Physella acuta TaxID=109671 RepID=UPI0027DD0860|nr:uncharacterized protein LOC131956403 [Physella acuta]